jgi:hypothetical protein
MTHRRLRTALHERLEAPPRFAFEALRLCHLSAVPVCSIKSRPNHIHLPPNVRRVVRASDYGALFESCEEGLVVLISCSEVGVVHELGHLRMCVRTKIHLGQAVRLCRDLQVDDFKHRSHKLVRITFRRHAHFLGIPTPKCLISGRSRPRKPSGRLAGRSLSLSQVGRLGGCSSRIFRSLSRVICLKRFASLCDGVSSKLSKHLVRLHQFAGAHFRWCAPGEGFSSFINRFGHFVSGFR